LQRLPFKAVMMTITDTSTPVNDKIKIENFSKESAFVYGMPGFENLNITTLISSSDVLPGSPDLFSEVSRTVWES
jgi:hypothetical protein